MKISQPSTFLSLLTKPTNVTVPILTNWTNYVRKHIDELNAAYYMYLGFEQFSGYPDLAHRTTTDDPWKWLGEDVKDQHTPDWWTAAFERTTKPKPTNMPYYEFDEFVRARWVWVTDGSTRYSRLLWDGEAMRTKFGAAVSLSDDELLALAHDSLRGTQIDMFVKPDEKGYKRRLIANMDLGSYLVAAYLRYNLQRILGIEPEFMTATTDFDQDIQVMTLLRGKQVAIPLDESAYDYHLSRNMWLGFLEYVRKHFPQCAGFVSMFHSTYVRAAQGKFKWNKGMPSGLALTSLLNTWTNYIKQSVIDSPIHFALGDDALIFNDQVSLTDLEAYYATFGAEVNPKKNFRSRKYAEFLKFVYTRDGRTGYPARIYSSLIWGLKFSDNTPTARLQELATLLKEWYDRAILPPNEAVIACDLSRAVSTKLKRFSASDARTWLHIPSAYGGFGLVPWVNARFRTRVTTEKVQYTGNLIRLPPRARVLETEWSIERLSLKYRPFKLGPPLHLPPVDTMEQWERRLNGEDVDLPNNQRSLALATIPLPRMSLVSDVKMSQLAASLGYNSYPNLRGSVATIEERLNSAAASLHIEMARRLGHSAIVCYL